MKVLYKTADTKKLCTNFAHAKKKLPYDVATKLMANINFIEQATCFSDIINHAPFHFHKLHADRKDEYALDVGRKLGYRIQKKLPFW